MDDKKQPRIGADEFDLGSDFAISRTHREPAGHATWVYGKMQGYLFDAVVLPKYAINREGRIGHSRVSILRVRHGSGWYETVYHRGIEGIIKPAVNCKTQAVVNILCETLAGCFGDDNAQGYDATTIHIHEQFPITYHQAVELEFGKWAKSCDYSPNELRRAGEEAIRHHHLEAKMVDMPESTDPQLLVFCGHLNMENLKVYYSVSPDAAVIRGYGWATLGEPSSLWDEGGFYYEEKSEQNSGQPSRQPYLWTPGS